MRRAIGVLFGVGTQLVFLLTVWRLFAFLRGDVHPAGPIWLDYLLAGQFAVVHSLLLRPPVRKRLEARIGASFYGCLFALTTCGGLWLMFLFWRSSPQNLWNLTGWPIAAMDGAFYGAWVALFYSLWLNGLGYQT
jgi:methanethiol S-methyltransferase